MSQINFEPGVTVTTFAGSGFRGYLDGKGQETMFYYITDIALAVDGTLFVNDRLNYRIRRVAPDLTVTTMLGDGTQITKNGCGTNFASSTIFSITVGPKGDLYFSDDVKIKKMTSDGCVSVVAGAGAGFQDGPALSAKFGGNMEVAFDSEGSLYITDPINHRIRLLSANGVVSSPIGSGDTILRDGRGIFSGVPNPRVLLVSKQGDLFFCDGNNGSVIRKVAADLTIVSLAGKDDSFGGHVEGPLRPRHFWCLGHRPSK